MPAEEVVPKWKISSQIEVIWWENYEIKKETH